MKARCGILFFLAAGIGATMFGAPKAEWDSTHVSVGDLPAGEARVYTLNVKNTGDEALTLRVLSACCGVTLDMPQPVEPGNTDTITLNVNMKGQSGRITRLIRIGANDPGAPETVVRITGNVIASETNETPPPPSKPKQQNVGIKLLPEQFFIAQDETLEKAVVIVRATDLRAFNITETVLHNAASSEIATKQMMPSAWQVTLSGVKIEDAEKDAKLEIRTTHPKSETVHVMLRVTPENDAE